MEITKEQESILIELLRYYGRTPAINSPDVKPSVIVDRESRNYMLIDIGWEKETRVHDCNIHFEIVENKIWIQCNNTDLDLVQELKMRGIEEKSIVPAFLQAENGLPVFVPAKK
ncbi:MAG: XisI protein [Leptospiraceae bacterium]|nr:XisI protein [Leptospiraceae bacterium]MCP5501764.1 XisI protein [Leptospiraceae bacterium]